MLKIALVLSFLACEGHGRRVKVSETLKMAAAMPDSDGPENLEQIKKQLSGRKFKKIRALEKRINKQMTVMTVDPKVQEFNEHRRSMIDLRTRALMADPQFQEVQQQSQRIDDMMKELMAHPHFKEYDDKMKLVDDQLQDLLAEPKYQEQKDRFAAQMKALAAEPTIQELTQRIDAQVQEFKDDPNFDTILANNADFQTLTKLTDEKVQQIMARNPEYMEGQERARVLEEQMKTLNDDPEFQNFLELTNRINAEMKAMKATPSFKKFEAQVKRIHDDQAEDMSEDPKFKKVQQQVKRLDYQIEKMVGDPNFEEYQRLSTLVAKLTNKKGAPDSQSLAQLGQTHNRLDDEGVFAPVKSLALLFPQLYPTAAFNANGLREPFLAGSFIHKPHLAVLQWQSKLGLTQSQLSGLRLPFGISMLGAIRKVAKLA